jgi:asparagine synthase (glutamine-hydrolysing)
MCGFAGIVDLDGGADAATAIAMADALRHRGPDDSASYADPYAAFGFQRLSIIDLSVGGRQPMADETGRFRLAFNGEIYNYRELRHELAARGHRFRSQSDSEVILAAYAEWGGECVKRFNGMWAFAIWDSAERSLFASRDRFGIKPFYYRVAGGRIAFASELKAFRADPETPLSPNVSVVTDFLVRGDLERGTATFFEGIVKLPQAHSLRFGAEGVRIERYWRLEQRDPPPGDPAESVREAFVDALRLHLRSDVPVGTCLSGGIDSSAIVCGVDHLLRTEVEAARPVGDRQQTFTAYFERPGYDERPFAEAVVDRTETAAHWITFDDDRLLRDLPTIVEAQDEPFGSTSIVAQWYVMQAAREAGLKVMLDGQGGDEVFGGYRDYFESRFADLLLRGRIRALATELHQFRRLHAGTTATVGTLAKSFVPASVLARVRSMRAGGTLLHDDLRAAGEGRNGHRPGSPFRDHLRRRLELLLTEARLPELLRYEDRNSMSHSIEARVPFLDYRLVELAFSLSGDELIRNGRTKVVLRRALADLLPQRVLDRTDKLGFVTPEAAWLNGKLGDFALDVFSSPETVRRGFIDAAAARRRLERHRRGEIVAGFELWRALSLELWARAFVEPRPR